MADVIEMPDDFRKQQFLEWLCTPVDDREPRHQKQLAEQLQLSESTLTKWKKDKEFLEAWERLYLQTIGSPERRQRILDTMYQTASDRDDPKHVQAGKTYIEITEGVKPTKMQIEVTRPAAELSDDQLDDILAAKIAQQRSA